MKLQQFTVDLESQKSISDHINLFRTELRLLKTARQEAAGIPPTGRINNFRGVLTNLDEGHNSSERIKLYLDDFRALRRMNRAMYGREENKVRTAGSVLTP